MTQTGFVLAGVLIGALLAHVRALSIVRKDMSFWAKWPDGPSHKALSRVYRRIQQWR